MIITQDFPQRQIPTGGDLSSTPLWLWLTGFYSFSLNGLLIHTFVKPMVMCPHITITIITLRQKKKKKSQIFNKI